MKLEEYIKKERKHLDYKKMPEKSEEMFESLLKQRFHHKRNTNRVKIYSAIKIAASVLLLVGAYSLGKYENYNSNEIAVLEKENLKIKKTAILSMIGNTSPGKRIEGINFIDELYETDTAVLDALINRMQYDVNVNVRITALRGLEGYSNNKRIKNALIMALQTEKDPKVLVGIIQTLVRIKEKKAAEPIQQLLTQNGLSVPVKAHVQHLLTQLL